MDTRTALIHQLLSIRSTVDAALLMLQDEDKPEPAAEPECDHPRDCRTNLSTMGGPERWQCGLCGFMYEGSED
jgi:hypothetical protein